jgi:outer membrane protein assembly factor BamB
VRGNVWSVEGERYNHLITTPDAVVAAGQRGSHPFLAVIDIATGERRWEVTLTAPAVKGGTAVDRRGNVIVSLRNGRVECYGARWASP